MREALQARRSWLEAAGWVLAAIGAVSFGHALWQAILSDGGAAYDLHAYVLAGHHLLDGTPLYGPMEINDPDAYRYPPLFALLAVPLALVPEEIVTWTYRAVGLLLVRYLVGSWRVTGVALLFPPLQIELIALNVTLPIAAAARALRRRPAALPRAVDTRRLPAAPGPGRRARRDRRLAALGLAGVRGRGDRGANAVGREVGAARRGASPAARGPTPQSCGRRSCR